MTDTQKPLVVLTRKLPQLVEARMTELFNVQLAKDQQMTRVELLEVVKVASVLVSTIYDQIDRELIAAAGPKLKLISNFGSGIDNIDINAAADHGILVTNTLNVQTEDTADMAMTLLLAVPRRLVEGTNVLTQKGGVWPGWSPNWMLGHRIWGKNLGIIGLGRIGLAIARRAKAFGLSIHYHDLRRASSAIETQFGATYWEDLDSMLGEMDIVSVNCPSTPETYHLISAKRLKLMRPSAYIINTARGKIIDEIALIDAIEQGNLAGAGMDVFEQETTINPRLIRLEQQGKVVLTPHMGSATVESRIEMGERVIINIRAFLDHHRPPDRIIPVRK